MKPISVDSKTNKPMMHSEEIEYLQELGFTTNPLNFQARNLEEIWVRSTQMETEKTGLAYPIDGMVVKLNDNSLVASLGVVGKTPRGWCAVKFKAEEATTQLREVTWQVGRTGKLTPVAELEPILISGTTVQRATLHNYKEFQETALRFGDFLVIRKAGEIIPEVVKKINTDNSGKIFEAPTICPSCGAALQLSKTGVDILCPNQKKCRVQIILRLSYFASRNLGNIEGLSEKNIERFHDEFGIQDIPDLYRLDYDKILELEGFKQKSVDNLKKSLEKSRKIADFKFLASLGIEGVGPEVAKLILQYMYTQKPE